MSRTDTPPERPSLLRGVIVAAVAGRSWLSAGPSSRVRPPPSALRLAYWIPMMVAGGVWGHLCAAMIERWIDAERRPWLLAAALTAAISGPVTVAVWALTGPVFGEDFSTPWRCCPTSCCR